MIVLDGRVCSWYRGSLFFQPEGSNDKRVIQCSNISKELSRDLLFQEIKIELGQTDQGGEGLAKIHYQLPSRESISALTTFRIFDNIEEVFNYLNSTATE